ncbi:MAG: tetratricopeptide repeat protein [Candidatus Omnitrophica bacterium]|nr:tetratricopeptide repeat protein [Candidatus Omnitrophota bacterium]
MLRITYYVILLVSLFLTGCSATTAFRSYPDVVNPTIIEIRAGKNVDINSVFVGGVNSNDKILYLMERGRLAQFQGNFEASKRDFDDAIAAIKTNDQKAIFSLSGAVAQGSSAIVNDNTIPYVGDGYERVMLHHYQALNYLASGDLEGAAVEARISNAEQDESLDRHQKEIGRAEQLASENRVSSNSSEVEEIYGRMDKIIGGVKNSFQNAYSFYLSGVLYEMQGQFEDAKIDYKKALEIYPDNVYLKKDVSRLSAMFSSNDTEIIVFFDQGLVEAKQEQQIPIPVPVRRDFTLMAVAFPFYEPLQIEPEILNISDGDKTLGTTSVICDFNVLAMKALKEKIPSLVTHQVIRAIAKYTMAHQAEQRMGFLGSLGAAIYNLASERADTRSWLTLPANAQIFRGTIAPGEHTLNFSVDGAQASLKVDIVEKSKNIVYVIKMGNRLEVKILNSK